MSRVLIGSVLLIVCLFRFCQGYSLGYLFVSMMSQLLIVSVLSIVYLCPWCHSYSLWVSCQSSICVHDVTATHCECLVNRLFVSMMSQLLIVSVLSIVYLCPWCHSYSLWVSCQSSICVHDVTATHCECLVNRLFVSMMSQLLIVSVLSIVYLCPWCHSYSLWVSCQSSICVHDVTATHCECLVNRFFCLHDVISTHSICHVIRLLVSIMLRVFIGSCLCH